MRDANPTNLARVTGHPSPRRVHDFFKAAMPWHPAEHVANVLGARDEDGRIAVASGAEFHRDGLARMTLGKVIQDNHRMSCFEQPVRNHAPDVARPARNQYSHIASVSKRRARRLPDLESFIFWIECCSTNNTQ